MDVPGGWEEQPSEGWQVEPAWSAAETARPEREVWAQTKNQTGHDRWGGPRPPQAFPRPGGLGWGLRHPWAGKWLLFEVLSVSSWMSDSSGQVGGCPRLGAGAPQGLP